MEEETVEETHKMEEETHSDIKPFNFLKGNTSQNTEVDAVIAPPRPKVKFSPQDLYYDMSGEKHMVIFNHHIFKETRYFHNEAPTTRSGTDEDVRRLKAVFGAKLGFKVVSHRDKDYGDLWNILVKMHKADYSTVSCLCIVILTHGWKDGMLYAADRPYPFIDVLRLFENVPTLANKPKLFLVQACRGRGVDPGNTVCLDGPEDHDILVTPSHADFLIVRSSVEEFRSYRDVYGSWLIQELCHVVAKHHEEYDFLQMLTLAHQRVAYGRSTHTPGKPSTHDKKCVPETSFTLTKFLKFS